MHRKSLEPDKLYSPDYWQQYERLATTENLTETDKEEEIWRLQEILNPISQKQEATPHAESVEEIHVHARKELEALEDELDEYYSEEFDFQPVSHANPAKRAQLMLFSPRARLRFLLEKQAYLQAKHEAMVKHTQDFYHETTSVDWKDKAKKLVDLIDDTWSAAREKVPAGISETLGAFFVGIPGFILHAYEGGVAIKRAREAYLNEKIPQRKTRIVTGLFSFMFAGTGAGMSLTLLAEALGATVSGTTIALAPTLIPGLLVGVYGAALFWKAYTFDQAKKKEQAAQEEYEEALRETQDELPKLQKEIFNLEAEKAKKYSVYRAATENASPQKETVTAAFEAYKNISVELHEKQLEYASMEGTLEGKRVRAQHFREARLEAEREVAFSTIEVACASLVTIGILLGAASILGAASVASFGAVPFALLITGVAVAFAAKYLEGKNEQHHFAGTNMIRDWLINTWNKVSGKKPAPTLESLKQADASVTCNNSAEIREKLLQQKVQAKVLSPSSSSKAKTPAFDLDLDLRQGDATSFLNRPHLNSQPSQSTPLDPTLAGQWCSISGNPRAQYNFIKKSDAKREKQLHSSLDSLQSLVSATPEPQPTTANSTRLTVFPKVEKGDIVLSSHSLPEKRETSNAPARRVKVGLVQECIEPGREMNSKLLLPEDALSSAQLLRIVDHQIQEGSKFLDQGSKKPLILTIHSLQLDKNNKPHGTLEPIDLALIQYSLAMGLTCQIIRDGERVTLEKTQLEALAPETNREAILSGITGYRNLSAAEQTRIQSIQTTDANKNKDNEIEPLENQHLSLE